MHHSLSLRSTSHRIDAPYLPRPLPNHGYHLGSATHSAGIRTPPHSHLRRHAPHKQLRSDPQLCSPNTHLLRIQTNSKSSAHTDLLRANQRSSGALGFAVVGAFRNPAFTTMRPDGSPATDTKLTPLKRIATIGRAMLRVWCWRLWWRRLLSLGIAIVFKYVERRQVAACS